MLAAVLHLAATRSSSPRSSRKQCRITGMSPCCTHADKRALYSSRARMSLPLGAHCREMVRATPAMPSRCPRISASESSDTTAPTGTITGTCSALRCTARKKAFSGPSSSAICSSSYTLFSGPGDPSLLGRRWRGVPGGFWEGSRRRRPLALGLGLLGGLLLGVRRLGVRL